MKEEIEYKWTEEDEKWLEEETERYRKEEEHILLNDDRILRAIKSVMGDEFHKEIEEFIENLGFCWMYHIMDEPKGDYQEEDEFPLFKGVWVDQWCNGGYFGDDYQGHVYIKIERPNKKDKYIQIQYSM